MIEVLFDVVFKGRFSNKIDKNKAILHFSKLFKLPVEKAEHFFDGKARTLKKSLSLEKANHFRSALKKAGLRVSLVKQVADEKAQEKRGLTMSEPGVVIVNKPFVQPRHFNTSQFSLDKAGIQLVEFKPVEKITFNLDQFHIDEVGVEIVEKQPVPDVDIDISALTLDEVGAIFAEKEMIEKPDLDISLLSMDEAGVVLVEKKTVPRANINIDDIELEDI